MATATDPAIVLLVREIDGIVDDVPDHRTSFEEAKFAPHEAASVVHSASMNRGSGYAILGNRVGKMCWVDLSPEPFMVPSVGTIIRIAHHTFCPEKDLRRL